MGVSVVDGEELLGEIIPLRDPDPTGDADGPPDDYFGPERDEDLAERLARGVPAGLVGPGIDTDTLNPATHLATINATLASVGFDQKSGRLKLTFVVPDEHQLMGLAIKDAGRMQMALAVYAPSRMARERYGRNTATATTPEKERTQRLNARIRDRMTERRFERARRDWTGGDGPE